MTTKFVGMKEFRKNLATYTRIAGDKQIRIIVLNKNTPVLDVRPVEEEEISLNKLAADVKKARRQYRNGEVLSENAVRKMLDL